MPERPQLPPDRSSAAGPHVRGATTLAPNMGTIMPDLGMGLKRSGRAVRWVLRKSAIVRKSGSRSRLASRIRAIDAATSCPRNCNVARTPHLRPTDAESSATKKAGAFRALHSRDGAFIIPNPWNTGTARLLADAGFEALATTSAGYAFSVGRPDGTIGRDETMAHVATIVSATGLHVSADLEDGFGDDAETVAETIRLGAEGSSAVRFEDAPGRAGGGPYALEHAVDRIRAAADAVHQPAFPFTLTARAENYLIGRHDLRDRPGSRSGSAGTRLC